MHSNFPDYKILNFYFLVLLFSFVDWLIMQFWVDSAQIDK